jgi:hypothetical protein
MDYGTDMRLEAMIVFPLRRYRITCDILDDLIRHHGNPAQVSLFPDATIQYFKADNEQEH